eukprot:m.131171 g.131171  ORF g.131171 m.131171 type:complete len:472 (-) comp15902_c0_seq3:95-1510(-)
MVRGGGLFFSALIVLAVHVPLELHLRVLPGAATKLYCHHVLASQLNASLVSFYEFDGIHRVMSFVTTAHHNDGSTVIHGTVLGRTAIVKYFGKLGCVLVEHVDSMPPGVSAFQPSSPSATNADVFGDPTLCRPEQRLSKAVKTQLQHLFDDEIAAGQGHMMHTRALALIQCGSLVAESYAGYLNVTVNTPLLGWSMSKSLMSMLAGARVSEGKLDLQQILDLARDGLDPSDEVTLKQLLNMQDGIAFSEVYGYTNDPSRMLFESRDTSGYTRRQGMLPPGRAQAWCYHSGATNIVSDMLRESFASPEEYLNYPWTALLNPLSMATAQFHLDSKGIFIGSSFAFASARDWARLGQLRLQNGTWANRSLIAPSFFAEFAERLPASGQAYSGGFWHVPPEEEPANLTVCAKEHRRSTMWMRGVLSDDVMMAQGYRDQHVIVSPDSNYVLVRLGHGWEHQRRSAFLQAVTKLLRS